MNEVIKVWKYLIYIIKYYYNYYQIIVLWVIQRISINYYRSLNISFRRYLYRVVGCKNRSL